MIELKNYKFDDPSSLSIEEAMAVMEVKKRTTYRALCNKFLGHECQVTGRDLARDAACRIIGCTLEQLMDMEFGKNPAFDAVHTSAWGDFYWWE